MSELTNIHARAVKDLTTPTELPANPDALEQVKLVAGNFPTEYAGNEALTVKQIKDLATVDLESKKANKTDVEVALSNLSTTANKFYPTLSEANSHLATMSVNAVVTIGEEANKGLWYKATAGATTLTKSAYDPLTQANNYTNNKAIATKTEAVAIAKNYTDLVFDAVPTVIAPYVAQAEAAATAATISAGVFETPEAGVDPLTGVSDGAYFNVRSPSSDSYIDEYQNIGGSAVATGKSYPSSNAKWDASLVVDASGETQQEINDFGGAKWRNKPLGYDIGSTVKLENGVIVKNTVPNNTNNPNVDMTGWRFANNTVESIADLVAIQNPKNGMTIKVKSYSPDMFLKGGGNFTFVANDLTAPNNVNIFAVDGGTWHRLNWKQPSIYDSGLNGSETDTALVNTRLQALVDAATEIGLSINLRTKVIKFTQLDLPSGLHVYNGTLDATSSTWHLTYGRGAMMFKTTPRNNVGIDYEQQSNYAALEETKNIKFVNVKFKAIEKMGYFYKFDGLKFLNCGGEWQTRHLFKLIGGWAGTPLVNDTPSSYNLINPINGRNKNILIKDCAWKGGYINGEYSSPFHLVACEEVDFVRGNIDAGIGYHIDIYNKNIRLHSANYHNTNPQIVNDVVSGVAEPDMLAVYIGQNCYDIEVNGGNWTDFGKKGLYIEVGSKVTIDGVIANMTIPNSDTTFIDIQPNYRDNTNTYWGNCADITIRNVKSKGTKYGINTSPFNSVRSIKELNVFNADIQTYDILQGVVLRGVDTYSLTDVRSKGQLFIGGNNTKGVVKGGSFHNAANYALYIDDLLTGELPEIKNTDFLTGSGAVIYNNGGAAKYGKIIGGTIYALDTVSSIISNGAKASNLTVMDFEYNGERHIIHPYTLTVAAGAKTSFYYNDGRFKSGWSCVANIINSDVVGDLDIRANVLSGSIYVTIENKSGAAISALPINIVLKLGTFASRAYPN